MKKLLLLSALGLLAAPSYAQLSQNPNKFLGNITTGYKVNPNGIEFANLWDQLTPENETKWGSIEGSRNNFNWGGSDNCYNYCKQHNIPLKFHCLVWGGQYPSWMDGLSSQPKVQLKEITEWMDAIKERYPDLTLIDVVNEAIPGHAPAPYKAALGGDGETGYDWIIKAFEMAHERWPNAVLIYNDYNTFLWNKSEFISLMKVIRDAGAPVDAYGCQSHDLTDMDFSTFKNSMTEIQRELKMPMYSSEYDIDTSDDQKQLRQYRDQIKYMWESDYVAGITLWGYIHGSTWVSNSGIIKNGQDRPAMTWLREYMASDEAKAANSPFEKGYIKEASIYVRPSAYNTGIDEPCTITVDATMRTKTIEDVSIYFNNKLQTKLTEAPYEYTFTPESYGHTNVRALVHTTDGESYTRLGGFNVVDARHPFHGDPLTIPGVIEFEDFDTGYDGGSFHDSDSKNDGTTEYRQNCGGVDIIKTADGYAVGHTYANEWLEYTINVEESGGYFYDLVASSAMDGASIKLSYMHNDQWVELAEISIPNNGDWNSYQHYTGKLGKRVLSGESVLRVDITGSFANLDKITLSRTDPAGITAVSADDPGYYEVYTTTGVAMGTFEVAEGESTAEKLAQTVAAPGIYLVKNISTGHSHLIKR